MVITGFEYTYDTLSRIIEEKHLADNTKICYTYDSLSRVTNRTIRNECDEVISSENYSRRQGTVLCLALKLTEKLLNNNYGG